MKMTLLPSSKPPLVSLKEGVKKVSEDVLGKTEEKLFGAMLVPL